jgi:multisubunit Na+/H+ antiporter MnhC subunit
MSESIKKIGTPTAATMAVALALTAVAVSMVTPAFAAMSRVVIEESCENPAGDQPPGQQTRSVWCCSV